MYYVYFSTNKPEKAKKGWKTTRILFPIAPAEITTKVSGMNQTVNLINESEVNRIKGQKLTDISFDLRLPNQKYPFALYEKGEYKPAEYFLDKLKAFKKKNIPFKLWIIRKKPDNTASEPPPAALLLFAESISPLLCGQPFFRLWLHD